MKHLNKDTLWILSVYFMEGLPFALVTALPAILYKSFHYSNLKIAFFTSIFTLPWSFKPLIAPFLEKISSKKTLIVFTQFTIALSLFFITISLFFKNFYVISGLLFLVIACCSMIHDMNADGLYITSLNEQSQIKFIGIRSVFYQIGKLIGQGGLVALAGLLMLIYNKYHAWQSSLMLGSVMIGILALYHHIVIPTRSQEKNVMQKTDMIKTIITSYQELFIEFFKLPYLWEIVVFTLFYNLPSAQMMKIIPLFMLDKASVGGLGLTIAQVGVILEMIGTTSILLGILCSSYLLARISLLPYFTMFTTFYGFTQLGYWILANGVLHQLGFVVLINIISQFCYGLINGAYMFYLIKAYSKGKYPMSLYSVATALMVFGLMLGGIISGYTQHLLGYSHFFFMIFLLTLFIAGLTHLHLKKMIREKLL